MKYDVALSFAGEDREYVEAVATELKNLGVRVFYDNFETVELWGKDLYTFLQNIYQKDSEYVIFFISRHYARKLWTNHERQMAQARAFTEKREYILPARFDDSEVEGIVLTTGYIDLNKYSPTDFAKLIYQKINKHNGKISIGEQYDTAVNIIYDDFDLTEIDNLILKYSCEVANDKSSEYIFNEDIPIIQQKIDIQEDEFYESLEILASRGYIEADERVGSRNMHSFKITLYGYEEYAKSYIINYSTIKKSVATEIVNSEARQSRVISETITKPLRLVNHILEMFESKNFIQISRMIGSGDSSNLRFSLTNPELKRRLSQLNFN